MALPRRRGRAGPAVAGWRWIRHDRAIAAWAAGELLAYAAWSGTLAAYAIIAASLDRRPGRTWRPMIDTTNDPILAGRQVESIETPQVQPRVAGARPLGGMRVGVKKGMNRFTWDMRQEGATVFPGVYIDDVVVAEPQLAAFAESGVKHR